MQTFEGLQGNQKKVETRTSRQPLARISSWCFPSRMHLRLPREPGLAERQQADPWAALHVTGGIPAVPPVSVRDRAHKANEPLHARAEQTTGLKTHHASAKLLCVRFRGQSHS